MRSRIIVDWDPGWRRVQLGPITLYDIEGYAESGDHYRGLRVGRFLFETQRDVFFPLRLARRWLSWLPLVILVGCSSPTAPSPPVSTPPPVSVTPPPVVTPPVVTSPVADPFPPADPRFSMSFYRMFALDGYESPNNLAPLQRQAGPPNIYLFTVDDAGAPIDARTLDLVAATLINTTGALTGRFGLASLQRGTGLSSAPPPNLISVFWASQPNPAACGKAAVGGKVITLYPKTPGCRCSGNPAIIDLATVKHELGHALGFWHTDDTYDLMYGKNFGECDKNPSAREVYHASVAYGRPIGSLDR